MGDVVPYERPDIFTEGGACVVQVHIVDVRHVLVKPGLHWVVGATSVGLPVVGVSPGHSGFVDQVVHHAANSREYLTGFRSFQRHAGLAWINPPGFYPSGFIRINPPNLIHFYPEKIKNKGKMLNNFID